ncbi:MFS transporter [Fodinibius halophilus]|uniref:SLC45 family MFS transporter n=1 Tax=Fodinibius halophilus TaxID=1736908 RepID=A0A6M1T7B0_9BACT|nr:MFS transporter [Fodinibius halophilus]NGP87034.1 SLC45 family MFS transporter [Fodinibius halophilus]
MNKKNTKPKLTFWEIWNMSFGFLGIQFGFALQNANVSRIFETLGASVDDIPILWIAAPVTGLVVQPIIGHMSDKTWNSLGRRRPYFLFGAIFASLALFLLPNSPYLWIAAGMLWIMDASINVSMEPFRAFVGDMLPEEQHTKGFAMQTFFIGTGAVIASALPYIMTNWIGLANTAAAGEIPSAVKWSFYVGGLTFFASVLWTVWKTEEYPPEEFDKFVEQEAASDSIIDAAKGSAAQGSEKKKFWVASLLLFIGLALTYYINGAGFEKELFIFSIGIAVFGLVMMIAGIMQKMGKENHGLVVVVSDFLTMPTTMVQLSFVQFFSWFALFAMWIYTTAAVTSHIYGTSDTTSALYNEGADWVGICFAIYNGFAALIAFALPKLAKWSSRKIVHAGALLIGGISLAGIYFISDPNMLILPMLGIGLAWGSILAMPYAILSGAIPSTKMGVYMGLFNFFIVIPQIVAASILGSMLRNFFGGEAIYAIIAGGVSMAIAAAMMVFVDDKAAEEMEEGAAETA